MASATFQMSPGGKHAVLLHSNGTAVACDGTAVACVSNEFGQCDLSDVALPSATFQMWWLAQCNLPDVVDGVCYTQVAAGGGWGGGGSTQCFCAATVVQWSAAEILKASATFHMWWTGGFK